MHINSMAISKLTFLVLQRDQIWRVRRQDYWANHDFPRCNEENHDWPNCSWHSAEMRRVRCKQCVLIDKLINNLSTPQQYRHKSLCYSILLSPYTYSSLR